MADARLSKFDYYKQVWQPVNPLAGDPNWFASNPGAWAQVENWVYGGTNSLNDRFAKDYQTYSITYDQQQELARLQADSAQRLKDQQAQAESLKIQGQQIVDMTRAAGQAVTQSLQILGQGMGQGPAAQMTKRQKGVVGARPATASLRIGATSQGTGSGANVAV